jgi:tetratricopeptide (TPR) repeat protein
MVPKNPTPVEVVHFAKKCPPARAVTQTVPALELTAAMEVPGARAAGEATISLSPPDRITLGHQLFSLGHVQEARALFEALAAAPPTSEDAFVHTMLGTVLLALEEFDGALGCFEAALALDPDDVAARVYRGELRLREHRARLAADDFTLALELAADDDPFAERARRLLALSSGESAAALVLS